MNRDKILNGIGLILLGSCFLLATGRIVLRTMVEKIAHQEVIRFAHWQLESGVNQAFDEIAKEYMKMPEHAHVRVEQLLVPNIVFANWVRSQIIGGTAPELIEYGGLGINEEDVARYFEPLTRWVQQPNPYNRDNEFADVPWQNTFADDLMGWFCYNEFLQEFYSIPNTVFSTRIFYNKDLYRKIIGSDKTPETFEEMVAVWKKVQEYNQKQEKINGKSIVPVAGYKSMGTGLMQQLFQSQTQKLGLRMSHQYAMQSAGLIDYLKGKWTLDSPEVRLGLRLMHEVGQYMQPGFMQARRDDALFMFTQSNALMYMGSGIDATSIRTQVNFPTGIFRLPYPSHNDPVYGPNVLGTPPESFMSGLTFAVRRSSTYRHTERSIDFLQFMTSKKGNQMFTNISGWLPIVVGVEPSPQAKPFMPVNRGFMPGFGLGGGTESNRLFENNAHLLMSSEDRINEFVKAIEPNFADAMASETRMRTRIIVRTISRHDTTLAALWCLSSNDPEDKELQQKISGILETQNEQESFANIMFEQLEATGH